MKIKLVYLVTVAAVLIITTGCKSMLGTTASANSVPVNTGAATTNDVNAVAYLELARQLNATLNATPSSPLVNDGLTALIALVSGLAGALAHKYGVASGVSAAASQPGGTASPPKA